MAILYTCGYAVLGLAARLAQWRCSRARATYERAQAVFHERERDVKAEEVRTGRAVGFAEQIRLMKAYERHETLKASWLARARGYKRLVEWRDRLAGYRGKKIAYVAGLADTVGIAAALETCGVDVSRALELITTLS